MDSFKHVHAAWIKGNLQIVLVVVYAVRGGEHVSRGHQRAAAEPAGAARASVLVAQEGHPREVTWRATVQLRLRLNLIRVGKDVFFLA